MLKKVPSVVGMLFLSITFGQAQESRWNVSVGAAGIFSKQSAGNGIALQPTQIIGALLAVRVHVGDKSSLELSYSRAQNSQVYDAPPFTYRVQATVSEFTGAYVFRPMHTKKYEPFFLIGAGVLVFNPNLEFINATPVSIGATRQTTPAFPYGVGVDYHLFSRFALRLQYRGLFYRAPDFHTPVYLYTGAIGHMAEPSAGVVIRF